jgi:hypothetical protein
MNIKAYGFQVELSNDKMFVTPTSSPAVKALGGEAVRTIDFENIVFLELKKGNLLVNTRIIIGEPEGKTYIPFVPLKKNNVNAELLYNALYASVKPYGKLSNLAPKGLRNDRVAALKDAYGDSDANSPKLLD